MDAQFANAKLNIFTGFLSGKVNEYNKQGTWQGAGGLRVSSGTSLKQAQENTLLAQIILNSSEIRYDCYKIEGHGIVTIDRKRGKTFIGNKLSHMRKPSAYYKGKKREGTTTSQRSSCTKTRPGNEEIKVKETGPPGLTDMEVEDQVNKKQIEVTDKDNINSQLEAECDTNEFLMQRKYNIEKNNKELLKIGLINKSQAIMIALFHLGARQKKSIQMKAVKEECKKNNIAFTKSSSKDDLCNLLGKYLFESRKIFRVDEEKGISFDNLKSA